MHFAGTIRDLFQAFVTGRGLLPALRNRPAAVWRAADERCAAVVGGRIAARCPPSAFPQRLLPVLKRLTDDFRAMSGSVDAIFRGADPFEALVRVIGLQASSVSFESRKAVGDRVSWNALVLRRRCRRPPPPLVEHPAGSPRRGAGRARSERPGPGFAQAHLRWPCRCARSAR